MTMVRRFQTWLFVLLLVASAAMGVVLWQLREHAHQRLLAGQDTAPTQAPVVSPEERATLLVANEAASSAWPEWSRRDRRFRASQPGISHAAGHGGRLRLCLEERHNRSAGRRAATGGRQPDLGIRGFSSIRH